MPSDSLPMFRIVCKRGQVEEILVGPTAGKTLIRVLLIVAVVGLLAAGVVTFSDVASAASAFRLPW